MSNTKNQLIYFEKAIRYYTRKRVTLVGWERQGLDKPTAMKLERRAWRLAVQIVGEENVRPLRPMATKRAAV